MHQKQLHDLRRVVEPVRTLPQLATGQEAFAGRPLGQGLKVHVDGLNVLVPVGQEGREAVLGVLGEHEGHLEVGSSCLYV